MASFNHLLRAVPADGSLPVWEMKCLIFYLNLQKHMPFMGV